MLVISFVLLLVINAPAGLAARSAREALSMSSHATVRRKRVAHDRSALGALAR